MTSARPPATLLAEIGLGAPPLPTAAALAVVAAAGCWRESALVALPEELLFRGVLLGLLATRGARPAAATALAAALFALAHVAAGGGLAALLTFFPGLLFGALRFLTGSIWPAVAAHAVANHLWLGGAPPA